MDTGTMACNHEAFQFFYPGCLSPTDKNYTISLLYLGIRTTGKTVDHKYVGSRLKSVAYNPHSDSALKGLGLFVNPYSDQAAPHESPSGQ
jgi:hypothetical protein